MSTAAAYSGRYARRRLISLLLAGAGLVLAGCEPADTAPETSRTGFDAERAFVDLRDQVALGPRPPGSPTAQQTRELIAVRLRQAGWPVEKHAFLARPNGRAPVEMTNLIATRMGRSPELLVLAAHYDTKNIPGVRFVGANDAASGVALLLELARALGTQPSERTVKLVFFDGEEAFGDSITATDGLYGSRALAERMQADGSLRLIRALVLFDMIADRDLNLAVDQNSSPSLRSLLQRQSGHLIDPSHELRLIDDHLPFRRRGVREVLALIDFQFGARHSPGPFWHTARDDLNAVSVESMNSMGRLAVELVRTLERP